MQGPDLEALKQIILDEGIVDPISGTTNWTDVRQFNLMFSTEMGASADATNKIYLRPETAQGIFVNFLNVQKTGRMKLPFGICQIGKAFRNEIVARQFVFRMREFEQMEMQFFCQPGTEMKWFEYWKKHRLAWHEGLGMGDENYRFHATRSWLTMLMQQQILSSICHSASRRLRVFIHVLTLTFLSMRSTLAVR